jgi:hypothetical protein
MKSFLLRYDSFFLTCKGDSAKGLRDLKNGEFFLTLMIHRFVLGCQLHGTAGWNAVLCIFLGTAGEDTRMVVTYRF